MAFLRVLQSRDTALRGRNPLMLAERGRGEDAGNDGTARMERGYLSR